MTTMQGMAVPGIKADPDMKSYNGANVAVKDEPDLMDIAPIDDDIYEDAGDLDFSSAGQGFCLTRLPKYVWNYWSQLDDDQEITLGTIRVEGTLQAPARMSLLLKPDMAKKHRVPVEYVLESADTVSKPTNTFIFSEKDLPGYSSKNNTGIKANGGSRPAYQSQGPQGVFKQRGQRGRGIPKQTALVGRIPEEKACRPVENSDYRYFLEMHRAEEAEKKKKSQTLFEPGLVSGTATLDMSSKGGTSFIKTQTEKKKSQKMKAARVAQNDLLDSLYECFKKYEYWPMKALIADLKQPAAYLKETLEMVAHLVRSGRFANNWQLKPEHKMGSYEAYEQVKGEQAPDQGLGEMSDFKAEDDEGDEEMEDVLPA